MRRDRSGFNVHEPDNRLPGGQALVETREAVVG